MNLNIPENDYYPPFSEAEYKRRYATIRGAMKEKGLDCLLVYSAHAFAGQDLGNIQGVYLSSYAPVLHGYIVFPLTGEPTLAICQPTHLDNARDLSVIEDVRALGNDIEITAGQRLKELGLEKGNIGIVGPVGTWFNFTIPVEHHNYFRQLLPGANFQTVTPWYENLRLIKSEEEIRCMDRSGFMTGHVYEEMVYATKPGVKHSDLRKLVESAASRLGGRLAFPNHIGSTPMANPIRSYPDFYATGRIVNAGDVIQTEGSIGYAGYFTKIWGTYFVGEPTSEFRRIFELAASVRDNAVRELKPGMTGRDAKKYVEPIRKAGYTTRAPLVLGWSTYNTAPSVGALDGSPGMFLEKPEYLDYVFKPGLCVDILAWVTTPDMKKGVWLGSTCVFTENGLRELCVAPITRLRVT